MQKSVVAVIINVNIKTFISKKKQINTKDILQQIDTFLIHNRYVFATQSSHFKKVLFLVLVRE